MGGSSLSVRTGIGTVAENACETVKGSLSPPAGLHPVPAAVCSAVRAVATRAGKPHFPAFSVFPTGRMRGPSMARRLPPGQALDAVAWFPIVAAMNGLDHVCGICPEIIR